MLEVELEGGGVVVKAEMELEFGTDGGGGVTGWRWCWRVEVKLEGGVEVKVLHPHRGV